MTAGGARPEPRGRWIDIGGRRLHLVRAGVQGEGPLVVLEAGSFGFSADWAVVQALLAARGVASIAYDRAGLGLSDPGPAPRDARAIVADLEQLLTALDERGRVVLAGHSMAGLHIHLFAQRHPGRIAGLVFVDAVTPAQDADPWVRRGTDHYVNVAKAAAWAASRGLLEPLRRWSDQIGLPPEAAAHKHWAFGDAAHNRVSADEVIAWSAGAAQAREAGPLDPTWPVAVVLAGPPRGPERQRLLMVEPARRSTRGFEERVVKAHHANLLGARFAEAVARGVIHVRDAAMEAGT